MTASTQIPEISAAKAFKRRLIDSVTMLLVSGLSLILLMYIGFGEAQRTYQQFHLEKLVAQGRVIQNAINNYLSPGFPLKQYVGFARLADRVLASDDSIASMTAFNRSGRPVFTSGGTLVPLLNPSLDHKQDQNEAYDIRRSDQYFQVVLPLQNRFERVGSLAITMPRSVVKDRVEQSFEPLLLVAAALSIAFALFVSIAGPRLSQKRMPWLQIAYAFTFLVMSGFVIGTLINLYSDGAHAKTKALADSLGQRVSDIVAFNLNIDEFEGLDETFGAYRRLNPDISAAGLTIDGIVKIHTNPAAVGKPWVSDSQNYEYVVNLTPPDSVRTVNIAVALPAEVVYNRVARSVKNFAALFVASAFLAGLFLQLAASMQRSMVFNGVPPRREPDTPYNDAALNLVKPVFFVAVFVEHLNYSFLPQFMHTAAAASGLPESYASAPFMIYYLCFALALIPSGHFAQNHGPKPLMYCGLLLAAGGLIALSFPIDFYSIVVARAASGIGQGMLFIGVQSYILTMASPHKKTQGAAIIVYGFQGGMISGMAIGSLLVTYMGPEKVFTLAGLIGLVMAVYAASLVPAHTRASGVPGGIGLTVRQLGRDIGQVLRNADFLKTMMFIGVPAKAVMTGVIIFALPLLLSRMEYPQEDIGQIIMLYAAGVFLASMYISRFVDRNGNTVSVLFWGAATSGIGLFMIALLGWSPLASEMQGSTLATAVLIAGVVIVGLAHGCINAPVVTHIADSELATRIGATSATATYRFLERAGHVVGPIILGQLFYFTGQKAEVVAWVGAAVLIFGFLFILRASPSEPRPVTVSQSN